MKGVILAGGFGTRLRPLTDTMPKPMVPIHGRPCMEYAVDLLRRHGIIEIASTLHYFPHMIQYHFGDGSAYGIRMRYYIEKEPLGTAGSVRQAKDFLTETFVVLSGDGVTDIDLGNLIRFHKQKKALATMAVTEVEDPSQFGVVDTEVDGRIRRFIEKPKAGEAFCNTVNTGIYVFEPEIFDYIPAETCYDFSKNLFPQLLAQQAPFFAYSAQGYWCDIGTREQYRQVHLDILDGKLRDAVNRQLLGVS